MNNSREFDKNNINYKVGVTRRADKTCPRFYVMLSDAIKHSSMRSGMPGRIVNDTAGSYLQQIRLLNKVCDPWDDRMRSAIMEMQPPTACGDTNFPRLQHDGPQRVVVIVVDPQFYCRDL